MCLQAHLSACFLWLGCSGLRGSCLWSSLMRLDRHRHCLRGWWESLPAASASSVCITVIIIGAISFMLKIMTAERTNFDMATIMNVFFNPQESTISTLSKIPFANFDSQWWKSLNCEGQGGNIIFMWDHLLIIPNQKCFYGGKWNQVCAIVAIVFPSVRVDIS